MLEVGVKYAAKYETGHGIGISTFLYRRMRVRYTDWLRATLGDPRPRGVEMSEPPQEIPHDRLEFKLLNGESVSWRASPGDAERVLEEAGEWLHLPDYAYLRTANIAWVSVVRWSPEVPG
jgi:hypothetical protein